LVVVWFGGIVGQVLVDLFADGLIRLTDWSLSLSAPAGRPAAYFGVQADARTIAEMSRRFWLGVVYMMAHGWTFSYFWTSAALLYLGLRHEVDGTPWTQIDPPGIDSRAPAPQSLASGNQGAAPTP
jgi:hypothetical protein